MKNRNICEKDKVKIKKKIIIIIKNLKKNIINFNSINRLSYI